MLLTWYGNRKLRKLGKNLLELSEKVQSLRQDILPAEDLAEQRAAHASLDIARKGKPLDPAVFNAAAERLHLIMVRNGGKVYPVTVASDWTEMFVLAAIVAGAIRSFFLQPFKIPTNSMWPTYHGMTAEVRKPSDPVPSAAEQAWGKFREWSKTVAPLSPASGEVLIPVQNTQVGYEPVPGDRVPDGGIFGTGLLRGVDRLHSLRIGERSIGQVRTPDEFSIRSVYLATFFPREAALPHAEATRWQLAMKRAEAEGRILQQGGQSFVRTGMTAAAGQPLVNFDILTGDMLFVDKMRYHFVNPEVGDPFVFTTGNIPELSRGGDQYYIKRLVGLPGETLHVVDGRLERDGKPAGELGSPIDLNSRQATDLNYFGYLPRCTASDAMPLDTPKTLSERGYYAMGDNSSNSYDSRGWGEVPRQDVVGPALFILYPFTPRWGVAE
jgi:signal peptidase I